MSKKPAPFLLRLYEEREEDRVILEGLEKHTAIKGDKTRLIKKILFEYFSGHSSAHPSLRANARGRLGKECILRERKADETELPPPREEEGKGECEEMKYRTSMEHPDEADTLRKNLSALSDLLL